MLLGMSALLGGCGTAPKDWESPLGPLGGDQFGAMEIIGISSKVTVTLNRPDARSAFVEDVTVDVPVGTEFIVPSIRGWRLAYGSLEPDTIQGHAADPNALWHSADRPFGVAAANVFVKDINAPDTSTNPATQTAVIEVTLDLADYNLDDRWFGLVNYSLIFLKGSGT